MEKHQYYYSDDEDDKAGSSNPQKLDHPQLQPALLTVRSRAPFQPSSGVISNRMSGTPPPASSLITNPGVTSSRPDNNYQYHHRPSSALTDHDDMAATPFALQYNNVPYMQQVYPLGFPSPNLPRYTGSRSQMMDNPMGILSAEQYDDRGASLRSGRRQEQQQVTPFGLVEQQRGMARGQAPAQLPRSFDREQSGGERRRKKRKLSNDDDGDEDAAKKSRGRPRLDTKDETAADRRRTQIRIAQRAYRHRKETTISSLEKKVQELRGVNEEMSNIFISLHDLAVGRGLLQREPEFGGHLKATTERFLALAKSVAAEENAKGEESNSLDGNKQSHSDAEYSRRSQPITPQTENQATLTSSVWGYQIIKEENRGSERDQVEWNQQPFMAPTRQGNHQIISRPTFDNASFSFDLIGDNFLRQYRAEVPDVDTYESILTFQEPLPLTKSLSQHESSFGRHLQRAALERGWSLISAKNPDPDRLNKVFGFCLRFETREDIALRLKRALETTSKDPLFEWHAPFVHLGGSGTHYPLNEDISGNEAPKFRTGMSMGPFSSSVMDTRETAMFDDFHIKIPGFEGQFFDSNDVDSYLRARGINIPPNVEFVTVDLVSVATHINEMASPRSYSDNGTIKPFSPKTPESPEERFTELSGLEGNFAPQMGDNTLNMTDSNVDVDFSTSFAEWNDWNPAKTSDNPFNLAEPIFNTFSIPEKSMKTSTSERQERVVTLNVTVLVDELTSRAICLGRATGFRPADVDSALRRALEKAF